MDRPKLEVADIFRRYGEAYREQHGASMSSAQRRVMTAIELCRTAALGGHLERCDCCDHERPCYDSCGNRHCPKCQSLARAEWVEKRTSEVLPTHYFHVVFTIPEQVASIAYQNKDLVYGILFRATAETLSTIAADPQHLGAEIGFFAVLHSWGQNLFFHPHLHCVVPGGGISPDGARWISCRPNFFLPVKVLSRLSADCSCSICSRPSTPASCSSSLRFRRFMIATATGNNSSGFGRQYCAYHSSTSSTVGNVAYTNLPYITDAGASCGANFNGLGPKAGITIVSGHEMGETITDQFPNGGWLDSGGAENGDKCAWISSGQGASADINLSTGTFAVQSLWSNAFNSGSGGCVLTYP